MLCSRAVGHEILALPDEDSPAASARTVLQRHRIHYVLMPDDRTLFDIDTPEDLAEAQRRLLNHSFSQNSG